MRSLLFETRHGARTRRWALRVDAIVEVLPLIEARPVDGGPRGTLGVFDFHGSLTPLVDFALAAGGEPAARTMGSRVVVASLPSGIVGLLVERVLGLERIDFDAPGGHSGAFGPSEDDGVRGLGGRLARFEGTIVEELRLDRLAHEQLRGLVGGGAP